MTEQNNKPDNQLSYQVEELKRLYLSQKPFPKGIFDPQIEDYFEKKAKILNVNYGSIAFSFLGIAAVALGGKKKIKMGLWIERAIIRASLVGGSGEGKTQILNVGGWSAVRCWQKDKINLYTRNKQEYEEHLRNWQSAKKEDRGQQPKEPAPPEMCYTSISTIEALIEWNTYNKAGVSIITDEKRGMIDAKGQHKNGGGGSDQAFYLETFNADHDVTNSLCGKSLRAINDIFVCAIGGIQPELLCKIINDDYRADGFTARELFYFIETLLKRLNWREKAEVERSIQPEQIQLLNDLLAYFLNNRDQEITYEFSEEAENIIREFQQELEDEAFEGADYLFSSYQKLKTYTLRITLIIHCIFFYFKELRGEVFSRNVGTNTVLFAIEIIKHLKVNTDKAFHTVFQNRKEQQREIIINKLKKMGGEANKEQLKQSIKKSVSFKEAECLINEMTNNGFLTLFQKPGDKQLYIKLTPSGNR